MKTLKLHLQNLQNEEHFQFNTEFKDLVTDVGAANIDIESQFALYLPLLVNEDEALQVIRKSAITGSLATIDSERDSLFGGLAAAVKSSLKHYSETNRSAAARLQVVFDQFGNIARESYDKETADIDKLVKTLQGTYSTDVATLGLTDWIIQIDAKNGMFDSLMKNRYSADAAKTEYRVKQARVEVDAAYRAITDRLDALMLVNGAEIYLAFVNELNSRIDRYKLIISQRQGRNAKQAKPDNE